MAQLCQAGVSVTVIDGVRTASAEECEFWLLFPTMFMRELPLNGQPLRAENVKQITEMFGSKPPAIYSPVRARDVVRVLKDGCISDAR